MGIGEQEGVEHQVHIESYIASSNFGSLKELLTNFLNFLEITNLWGVVNISMLNQVTYLIKKKIRRLLIHDGFLEVRFVELRFVVVVLEVHDPSSRRY